MLDCIFIGELWSCIKVKCKHAKDKEGGSLENPFSTYSRVWIIFSEVIFENLVSSSNSQEVWGSVVRSPHIVSLVSKYYTKCTT